MENSKQLGLFKYKSGRKLSLAQKIIIGVITSWVAILIAELSLICIWVYVVIKLIKFIWFL